MTARGATPRVTRHNGRVTAPASVDELLALLARGAGVHDEPEVDGLAHALQCGANLRASHPAIPSSPWRGSCTTSPTSRSRTTTPTTRPAAPSSSSRCSARASRASSARTSTPSATWSPPIPRIAPGSARAASRPCTCRATRSTRRQLPHWHRIAIWPRSSRSAAPTRAPRIRTRTARPRHLALAPRADRSMSNADFDVVVVGGGHNGLVAAGLLARRGARVTVLERRSQVGGAATTEQPWGPEFNVTALSYVVSLMPPTIVQELELAKHGYKVYPQHGYFAPYRDGRALQLPDHDPGRRRADRTVLEGRRRRVRTVGLVARQPRRRARSAADDDPAARGVAPRATSSTNCSSRGDCAGSASTAPPTSPGCSR